MGIFEGVSQSFTVDATVPVVELSRVAISAGEGSAVETYSALNSAKYDCTTGTLAKLNFPSYLAQLIKSRLSQMLLSQKTDNEVKEHLSTASILQSPVFGSLL